METTEKRGPGRPPKAEAAAPAARVFRVLRDYWPTDDDQDRVRAGTMIELTADEALDLIASGAIEKA